jgi:exopolysaccharide biosynthesis polyprenyl glycosylphosphotransferase
MVQAEAGTVPDAVRNATIRLEFDGGPERLLTAPGAFAGADRADSRRDSARRRLLAAADATGLLTAYVGMWLVVPAAAPLTGRLPLLSALVGWVVVNKLLGLYDRDDKVIHRSTLDELPKLLHSITLGTLLVYLVAPLLGVDVHRGQTVVFLALACLTVPGARSLARAAVRATFAPERCVILGSGEVAQVLARKIHSHPEYGVELVGHLDDPIGAGEAGAPAAPLLGAIPELAAIAREHGVERVIVAFTRLSNDRMLDIVRTAKRAQLKITIVPRLYEAIGHSVEIDEVEGMTVLSLRGLSRSRSSLAIKRALDVTAAALGLLVLSPLLAAIALAVKLDSRGPVLYRQRRMGRDAGFQMLKFRSMVDGADDLKASLRHLNEADGIMFKIAADPRVTRVGRWLRRTSLDELPQLWNVLRGEMSLVGPRPLVPDEDDQVMGWHRARLDLTPGLTGPWQVAGRTRVPFQEMVKMDYLYVAEWSLWNDLRLVLRTLPIVLLGRGH